MSGRRRGWLASSSLFQSFPRRGGRDKPRALSLLPGRVWARLGGAARGGRAVWGGSPSHCLLGTGPRPKPRCGHDLTTRRQQLHQSPSLQLGSVTIAESRVRADPATRRQLPPNSAPRWTEQAATVLRLVRAVLRVPAAVRTGLRVRVLCVL